MTNYLFSDVQFKSAKSRDLLPLSCSNCGKIYYRTKHAIMSNINNNNKNEYCSRSCYANSYNSNKKLYKFTCEQCGKEIMKTNHQLRSKHKFCSLSCATKYQNIHKITGFRRSKLEIYLETKLTELYPNLEILYNDRSTLDGLELDIYIPSLKRAFELNGPLHYIPVFGQEKLEKTQNNDYLKLQKCQELGIGVYVINVSKEKSFTEKRGQKYLQLIINSIN